VTGIEVADATDQRSASQARGRVAFVGGATRDVYEDADSRQWVAGYDGERVYGVWLVPADEPVIVARAGEPG
jgi:hypothetical protein